MTRHDFALALRDRAVALVEQQGFCVKLSGGPEYQQFHSQGFSIMFNGRADHKPPVFGPYSLELWTDGFGKVLDLTWCTAGGDEMEIVSFLRGEWEARLLCLRGRQSTAPMPDVFALARDNVQIRCQLDALLIAHTNLYKKYSVLAGHVCELQSRIRTLERDHRV